MLTFNDYYDHTIKDLLSIFPKDAKDKDGAPFWSGPKRAPSPIEFNPDNKAHSDFVYSYANLIAATLKIPENRDQAAVTNMARSTETPAYVPKKIKVELPPGEGDEE